MKPGSLSNDKELCEILPYNCVRYGFKFYDTIVFQIVKGSQFKIINILKDNGNPRYDRWLWFLLSAISAREKISLNTSEDFYNYVNAKTFGDDNGVIYPAIMGDGVYEKEANVFMIEPASTLKDQNEDKAKNYTIILDFNDIMKNYNGTLDKILRPNVTIVNCGREHADKIYLNGKCKPDSDCNCTYSNQ